MARLVSETILLPDDEIDQTRVKELKGILQQSMKSPEQRLFEDYYNAGLDRETAAELSNLSKMDSRAQANAVLAVVAENRDNYTPAQDVQRTVVYEVPRAFQSVGASAGSAVGTFASMALLRWSVQHSSALVITAVAGVGIVSAVIGSRFVSGVLGRVAGTLVAVQMLGAASIITTAIAKQRGWIKWL